MDKISIFAFQNDVSYLKAYLRSQPKHGHGLLKKWSEELGLHTTQMSQIMSGTRNFSEDQAYELVHVLSLPKLESEYFMMMVRFKNATTKKLRDYYQEKLQAMQVQSTKIAERVTTDTQLTEHEKAVFYSSWIYTAVGVACSIETSRTRGKTIEMLHQELHVPITDLIKIVDFLRDTQLLAAEGDRFVPGLRFTHLEKGSIYLPRHHANWRLRAIDRATLLTDQELMYTAPFSISKKHFAELRERCLLHIQDFTKLARDSSPEEPACFSMDLFYIGK